MQFDGFEIRLGFFVDQITIVMLAVVTFVALMVQIYSVGYMHGDPKYGWYFAVMSLFAASMLTLVLADNLLAPVRGVGGRRLLLVPAHRLLVGEALRGRGGEEGVHHDAHRRRRFLIGIILLWDEAGHVRHPGDIRLRRGGWLHGTPT